LNKQIFGFGLLQLTLLQLTLLQIGGEEGKNINFYRKIIVFPLLPANLQPTIQAQKFVYLKSSIQIVKLQLQYQIYFTSNNAN
jgi:hypothetical protein